MNLFIILIFTGPIVLSAGLAATMFFCWRLAAERGLGSGLILGLFSIVLSAAGYNPGVRLGIDYFCPDAGSLCGLAGFFGTGPMLSGLLLFGVAAIMMIPPAD